MSHKEVYQCNYFDNELTSIQFGIMKQADILISSLVPVTKGKGKNILSKNAACDPRMGQTDTNSVCATCGEKDQCPGHHGHISLNYPVLHGGYAKQIAKLLECFCLGCSSLLISEEQRRKLMQRSKRNDMFLVKKLMFNTIWDMAKKVPVCPHCKLRNGSIRRVSKLNIERHLFKTVKKEEKHQLTDYKSQMQSYNERHLDTYNVNADNIVQVVNPTEVGRIFNKINDRDLIALGMKPEFSHPKEFVQRHVLLPPNNIRPSPENRMKTGVNEDGLTTRALDLVDLNDAVMKTSDDTKLRAVVQWAAYAIIDGDAPLPAFLNFTARPTRGLIQRLKGKQGRFRGNLLGKRVNFSARSVISPDPTLEINQVGVPMIVARRLTFPEKVNQYNFEWMKKLVENGRRTYPGCEMVIQNNVRRVPGFQPLKLGDIVERHMVEGDVVLFNRQPSLHKNSIMCHTVKIHKWKTLRFNECVCTPYNADFDGDEMNLHFPQTYLARAEAYSLMGVASNLVTAKNGSPLIAAIQDFITGSHLMTQKDVFLNFTTASFLANSILSQVKAAPITLPPPCIMKPVKLWSGKQILSLVMRYNCDMKKEMVNLSVKKKGYKKDREMTFDETYVLIRNSEILAGSLDKSLIGSGSKKNVFYMLIKEGNSQITAQTMWRLARMSSTYMYTQGFTIGIRDVLASKKLLAIKRKLMDEGSRKVDQYIESFEAKTIKCQPGCDMDQTVEQNILNELSDVRETAGRACAEELSMRNSPLIMAVCGSKGSLINVSQMVACVGQQAVAGKRAPDGFNARGTPHFQKFCKLPSSKGFVAASFFSGLDAGEFVFHTMAGREGLIDTAVKTATTGYLQRRLVKFLEDLYVAHDNTVRNSEQDLIQFSFGNDGLDPTQLEDTTVVLDFERVFEHVRAINPPTDEEKDNPLDGATILDASENYLNYEICSKLSATFKQAVKDFIAKVSQRVDASRSRLNQLPANIRETGACADVERVTLDQLIKFLNLCLKRYQQSLIEPTTPIGAITATSLGEPATQMTLKTFHFAGVASMNITLGVPRILEILNANKAISTPVIKAQLMTNDNAREARRVTGRLRKTKLSDVTKCLYQTSCGNCHSLILELDTEYIKLIELEVDAQTIKESILNSKFKGHVRKIIVVDSSRLVIQVENTSNCDIKQSAHKLKSKLGKIIIKGFHDVPRVVVNQLQSQGKTKYELIVEGGSLRDVIATYGVDPNTCVSNHTIDVEHTLGIEAARTTIINDISHTMNTHGLDVNLRYIMLVADLMTCRGRVLGVNRHGLAKMNKSVLTLASFEQMTDHLFEAATLSQKNDIRAVSDCIVVGNAMSIGTGQMKILQSHKESVPVDPCPWIFDNPKWH